MGQQRRLFGERPRSPSSWEVATASSHPAGAWPCLEGDSWRSQPWPPGMRSSSPELQGTLTVLPRRSPRSPDAPAEQRTLPPGCTRGSSGPQAAVPLAEHLRSPEWLAVGLCPWRACVGRSEGWPFKPQHTHLPDPQTNGLVPPEGPACARKPWAHMKGHVGTLRKHGLLSMRR